MTDVKTSWTTEALGVCPTEDYLSIRTERSKAVLRIQHAIMSTIRSYLERQGFVEAAPVIISQVTDPGIRGAETASIDFYGTKYLLTTSMILHKQMLISAFDKIFVFSPCVRMELSQTKRHLAEFVQIDVEVTRCSRDEIIALAEGLIVDVMKRIRQSFAPELELLNRELKTPKAPFERITFHEAIRMAEELGHETGNGAELSFEAETAVSMHHRQPLWIIDYPVESRGFYYRTNPSDPQGLLDFDLIFPDGFGEAISGGEREHRYEVVLEKLRQRGLSLHDYEWYLSMLQVGIQPSAGFGLGLERFTRYICGLDDISEATAFPRRPATGKKASQ